MRTGSSRLQTRHQLAHAQPHKDQRRADDHEHHAGATDVHVPGALVRRDDDAAHDEADDQQQVREGKQTAGLRESHDDGFVGKGCSTAAMERQDPSLAHRLAHQVVDAEASAVESAREAIRAAPAKMNATKAILPVMDPRFNFREIAKHLLLLEDHLTQPRRRCPDCIRKHFATAEAFCEEAAALDKEHRFGPLCADLQEKLRTLQAELAAGITTHEEAAQQLRAIRKPLLQFSTEWLLRDKYGATPSMEQRRA